MRLVFWRQFGVFFLDDLFRVLYCNILSVVAERELSTYMVAIPGCPALPSRSGRLQCRQCSRNCGSAAAAGFGVGAAAAAAGTGADRTQGSVKWFGVMNA